MRKTGKFVVSKEARRDESAADTVTMNIKSGQVIKVRLMYVLFLFSDQESDHVLFFCGNTFLL